MICFGVSIFIWCTNNFPGEYFLFLLDNHHQTAVSHPIQQCSIVLKKENATVGLQDPEQVLEVFFNNPKRSPVSLF